MFYNFSFLFCLITDKTNEANTKKHMIATQGYIFKKISLCFPKKRDEIPNAIITTLPMSLIAGVISFLFRLVNDRGLDAGFSFFAFAIHKFTHYSKHYKASFLSILLGLNHELQRSIFGCYN